MRKSNANEIRYRTVTLERAKADKAKRVMEVAIASEAPVETEVGLEILSCEPGAVDLSRANNGTMPLLREHDRNALIGVVESARVDSDRKVRATVRFGNTAKAEEDFQNAQDGILRGASIGYRVSKYIEEKLADGRRAVRALRWSIFEVTLTSIPADASVGINRSLQRKVMSDENREEISIETVSDIGRKTEILAIAERAAKSRPDRAAEIMTLAQRSLPKTSLDQFKGEVLVIVSNAKPVQTTDSTIGMSDRDVKQYSLVRAILCRGENRQLDGLEKECSDEVAKKIGRKPNGFYVPADVQTRRFDESMGLSRAQVEMISQRALVSNVHSGAGAFVGTDVLGSSLIELLRKAQYVMQLGATSLPGLQGDIAIPRQTGGATCFWLGQGATLTRTQQVVDQLGMTPHRCAAATAYDKQLLAQSSVPVEAFVRNDLMTIIAIEKDRVAINGTGTNGEPLGIINTTGLSTVVTISAAQAPIFTDVVKFETNVAANDADRGRLGYLVTPTVRGNAKGTAKFTNGGIAIWENDQMNGYPARATNQVPTATSMIFGNWSDLIIADWDGLDVVVDPYSLSLQGQISVVIQTLTDVGLRHSKSFSISNQ